jgi:hypothetical protein
MRACEECQPFTPPCKTKRAKSLKNRIYISDTSIFSPDISPSCSGCGSQLGQLVTSSSPLYHDLGIDGRWLEISKAKVASEELAFLSAYTPLSTAGGFVEKVVNDTRTQKMTLISDSGLQTQVKVLSDVLLIYPLGSLLRPFRAIKCLVRCDRFEEISRSPNSDQDAPHEVVEALIAAVNQPQLPKELSPPGNFFKLMLLPLPPDFSDC